MAEEDAIKLKRLHPNIAEGQKTFYREASGTSPDRDEISIARWGKRQQLRVRAMQTGHQDQPLTKHRGTSVWSPSSP